VVALAALLVLGCSFLWFAARRETPTSPPPVELGARVTKPDTAFRCPTLHARRTW